MIRCPHCNESNPDWMPYCIHCDYVFHCSPRVRYPLKIVCSSCKCRVDLRSFSYSANGEIEFSTHCGFCHKDESTTIPSRTLVQWAHEGRRDYLFSFPT